MYPGRNRMDTPSMAKKCSVMEISKAENLGHKFFLTLLFIWLNCHKPKVHHEGIVSNHR